MTVRNTSITTRTFTMKGVSELQASLRQLPDKLQAKALENASAAGARIIRNRAKELVAVDEGQLRDNIVVARKVKLHSMRRSLRIAGRVFIGIRGAARMYVHLVEFGSSTLQARPFFRPALDEKAPEALKAMGEKLGPEIHRAAQKLTGWKSMRSIRRLTR